MGTRTGLAATYRRTRRFAPASESPRDRLLALIANVFTSRELPNILLGVLISTSLAQPGKAPIVAALYLAAVGLHVVGEEVKAAARIASRRFEDDPIGIE